MDPFVSFDVGLDDDGRGRGAGIFEPLVAGRLFLLDCPGNGSPGRLPLLDFFRGASRSATSTALTTWLVAAMYSSKGSFSAGAMRTGGEAR